ncbi:hypothetical protein HUJ05_011414 [Dendroctonus ponderosae]|nr:hypothetical protein HUJ05_011414 [Dendroctonus ponderosae]
MAPNPNNDSYVSDDGRSYPRRFFISEIVRVKKCSRYSDVAVVPSKVNVQISSEERRKYDQTTNLALYVCLSACSNPVRMKISILLVCTCAIISIQTAHGSPVKPPIYPLNLEDLSNGDEAKELEDWNNYNHRPKRTIEPLLGSAGAIIQFKTAAISGAKKTIIEIARGSFGSLAGASAGVTNAAAGSAGGIQQLKSALSSHIQKKIAQTTLGAASGSAKAINQLKSAALNGAVSSVAGLSQNSLGGSAKGFQQLKSAALNSIASQINQLVQGSSNGLSSAKAGVSIKIGQLAKASAGAASSASAGAQSLKQGAKSAVSNKISQIAGASASLATGASSGLQSKVSQVSQDIAVGGADVADQLRSAIAAGTEKKLGQAASGLTGALTAAVGSASAGVGQITRGVFTESSNLINQLKSRLLQETLGKLSHASQASSAASGQTIKTLQSAVEASSNAANRLKSSLLNQIAASSGQASKTAPSALSGSAGAINQLKNAALSHLTSNIGQIALGSASAASGASNSTHSLKNALVGQISSKISQTLRSSTRGTRSALTGSASAIQQLKSAAFSMLTGASGQASRGAGSAVTGSASAVQQLKSAALSQLAGGIGQALRGSASAATGASGHLSRGAGSAVSGSASAVQQLKSAALSQLAGGIGQVLRGSASAASGASGQASKGAASAVSGSSNAIQQLKSAALSQLVGGLGQVLRGSSSAATGAIGQASSGSMAALSGSANGINQLKSAVLSHLASKAANASRMAVGGVAGSSGQLSQGAGSAATGSARAVQQLKSAAVASVQNKVSQVAGGVANASRGAVGGVGATIAGSARAVQQLKGALVEGIQQQISNLAEASAGDRRKRSADGSLTGSQHGNLDEVDQDLNRRSDSPWASAPGSSDILNQLKSAVASGLKQKFVQLAKGSAGAAAGASAGFSKGSFSGHDTVAHSYHEVDEHKGLDSWDMKKSLLNTLLQAVKAIKGGVLAIKGQLIKGSGYVVAGGGKLLAASGDKVTKLGTNILTNAVSAHPSKDEHSHPDYGTHSSGFTAPSGPPVSYDGPPSSGHGYESHYESPSHGHYHDKPHGTHAGILILRKIPATHDKYHSAYSHVDESVVPSFKPIPPAGPTFGTVVGKFFSAATSLSPSEPTAFNDVDIHPYHIYRAEDSHVGLNPPGPPHFEEPRYTHGAAAIEGGELKAQSPLVTSYGTPVGFQEVNHQLASEGSSISEEKVKLTKGEILDHAQGPAALASSEVQLPDNAPDSLKALQKSVGLSGPTLGPPFNSDFLPNAKRPSALQFHGALPSRNSRFKKTTSSQELADPLANFLPKEDASAFSSQESMEDLASRERYMKFIENFPYYKPHTPSSTFKSQSSKDYLTERLRLMRVQNEQRHRRPNFSVMKSFSYEITPEGAKRLP